MSFKVGDRVEDIKFGWSGTILKVFPNSQKVEIIYDGDKPAASGVWPMSDYVHLEEESTEEVTEKVVTDPVTGAKKGVKPEQYSMIPVGPLAEVARVYGFGAQKYERENWRKGYAWSLSIDALYRHIEKFRNGERLDESGLHHLAHAVFHLFTLMEYDSKGLGTDDRGDVPHTPISETDCDGV